MVSLSPDTEQPALRSDPPPNTQRCRERAQRIRSLAEGITGAETRRQMLDVAAQYDVLAESEERRPR